MLVIQPMHHLQQAQSAPRAVRQLSGMMLDCPAHLMQHGSLLLQVLEVWPV